MTDDRVPDAGRTRSASIGIAAASAIAAVAVVGVVVALLVLGANAVTVIRTGTGVGDGFTPSGPDADPTVTAALTAFTFLLPLIGSAYLLALLARTWTYGFIKPGFHIALALVSYLPLLLGTSLIPIPFIVYFFPFPLLALAVLVVWIRTRRPIRDADPHERAAVVDASRRRIDRAVIVAVAIQVLFPAVLILLSLLGLGT